jgi:uncharacterized repeat protein (TIGR01451 family)
MTPAAAGVSNGEKASGGAPTVSPWGKGVGGVASTRVSRSHLQPAAPLAQQLSPTDPSSLINDPTADATAQDTQSETAIVLGSGSNVVSAFNDSGSCCVGNHFTGWSSSSGGGTSWTDHGALPGGALGDAGDPVLARSASTGTVFLTTLGFTSGANVNVFRSSDNGTTFAAPVGAYTGLAGADLDKEWIAVDNYPGAGFGNVYLVARDFGSSASIRFTKSTDDGVTWGPSGGLLIVTGQQGVFVAVGPDHSVYAFWYDSSAGNSIKMRKSTDFGVSFGAPVTVTTLLTSGVNGDLGLGGGFRSNAFPQVAINPVSGALYAVYNDTVVGDKANVYLRQSINGGTTWSAPILVNNDGGTNDQWSPSVAVTPNGTKLIVSWYDRRNDPADSTIQRFAGVASLKSGTPKFGREFAVSPSFPVVVGQDPIINTVYMGDYDMAAADSSGFYLPWGDNRDSDAAHAHQPDVRFAKVATKAPKADLTITQTASAASVPVGSPVTFTLTVHNAGAATASWVNVTDAITGVFGVTSVATTAGACGDVTPSCVLRSLAAGDTATITVNGTASAPGKIKSVAKVSHAGADPNSVNNTAKATVAVTGHVYFTDLDCAIPDNNPSGVDCPLSIADAGSVTSVSVSFRINHTFDGDLQVSVVAPDSTSVLLVNRRGGSGDNFGTGPNPCGGGGTLYTTLADFSGTPISSGAAPFAGLFAPESPLSTLNGHSRTGTWKLHVADLAAADVGTMLCWQLATT